MNHGKKNNHLGRTMSHRKAMLSNMATSLIIHKRINTTVAKAKELRKYIEPLITKAKLDTTHSRRVVFSYLQDKESIKSLFGEVATRTAERPGGYTRIIKLGDVRLGDAAEMCMMELVDFNDIYNKETTTKKVKTRRKRKKKTTDAPTELSSPSLDSEATVVEPLKEEETDTEKDKDKNAAELSSPSLDSEATVVEPLKEEETDTEKDKDKNTAELSSPSLDSEATVVEPLKEEETDTEKDKDKKNTKTDSET